MILSVASNVEAKFDFEVNLTGLIRTAIAHGANIKPGDKPVTIGNIVDKMLKDEVKRDKCLSILVRTTDSGYGGPDIYSLNLKHYWELTTPGQVATHKQYPEYGSGTFITQEVYGDPKW